MSKNTITLKGISVSGGVVEYAYTTHGSVSQSFNSNTSLCLDFYESVENVPASILAIPFVTNVLPIAWVYDADLYIPELDKALYEHVDDIKNGYINMYPKVSFGGSLSVSKVVDNSRESRSDKKGLMFSGGVDATSSLVSILKNGTKPRLITLWGADVALDDTDGWVEKAKHTESIANRLNLEYSLVKTNFRNFIDGDALTDKIEKAAGDHWWHGFQHGIGIIGHSAPLAYKYKLGEVYIAASFTRGDDSTCASDPTIDEHLHMGACNTIHDGYDMSRPMKVGNIQSFINANQNLSATGLPLKVCWQSRGAKNCGICEKCMRTACEILVVGGDPAFYDITNFDSDYMRNNLFKYSDTMYASIWEDIKARLDENRPILTGKNDIYWLLGIDFEKKLRSPRAVSRKYARKIQSKITRATPANIKTLIRKSLWQQ